MARYSLEISRTAERQLKKLRKNDLCRIVKAMLALADDPYPKGSRKLTGYEDVFRIRAGHFRVL